MIRAFRLLVEVLRQMVQAAKAIGNTELENKFAAAITAIKRDIVFAPSLVYSHIFELICSIYDLKMLVFCILGVGWMKFIVHILQVSYSLRISQFKMHQLCLISR